MGKTVKLKVQDVPKHSIVRFRGDWGVLSYGVLDRWHGGRLRLTPEDKVEMLISEGRAKNYSLRLPR